MLARRAAPERRGQAAQLAGMAAAVLADAGTPAQRPDAVAVSTGPGSFTGVRAALALAHGFSRATGATLLGVSVAEALASRLHDQDARPVWVAIGSRRGRIFLCRGPGLESLDLAAVPMPEGPVALAGDAAAVVAARLAARGADVLLSDVRGLDAVDVARIAAARLRAGRVAVSVLPLYADPPEARLPTGGRPAPSLAAPRQATTAHAGVLAAIHAAAFTQAERWDVAAFATLLSQPGTMARLDPAGGFVLARVAAGEAEILTLAVAPALRRQGRATALLRASLADAAAHGAEVAFLEVAAANVAALTLYARLGFAGAGTRRAYYKDGGDALLLRMVLGSRAGPDDQPGENDDVLRLPTP